MTYKEPNTWSDAAPNPAARPGLCRVLLWQLVPLLAIAPVSVKIQNKIAIVLKCKES
jgi:hypothetical protein